MISFRHVNKNYGSVTALRNVTFSIQPGAITALVGHNGAGKTTSLRMMVGLVSPDAGKIEINGLSPDRHGVRVRQQVIYAPDTPYVTQHLTGAEHLQFQADVYRQPTAMDRARQLAERYRIAGVLNHPVKTYSHGMVQKLALIRALMIDASVLLFDEPFNALDPRGIQTLTSDLKEQTQRGKTILVSSHLLAMLHNFAQDAIVLKHGQVVYCGSMNEVDWAAHMDDWFEDEDESDDEDLENDDENTLASIKKSL